MSEEFVPVKIHIPDEYRKDDLSNAYADAAALGLWVREFGGGQTSLCGVGSYYYIQLLQHENPDAETVDPWSEFTLGDCVELGVPGSGATRADSIRDGVRLFKESGFWEQHAAWHEAAVDEEPDDA